MCGVCRRACYRAGVTLPPHRPPSLTRLSAPPAAGRVLRAARYDQLQRVPPAAEGCDHHQVLAHVLPAVHQAQPRWAAGRGCDVTCPAVAWPCCWLGGAPATHNPGVVYLQRTKPAGGPAGCSIVPDKMACPWAPPLCRVAAPQVPRLRRGLWPGRRQAFLLHMSTGPPTSTDVCASRTSPSLPLQTVPSV